MEIVTGVISLILILFCVINVIRFFGGYLSGRMNLQDLRLHGKPHRSIFQSERTSLAGFAQELSYLGSMAPSYKPISDDVYWLKGDGKVILFSINSIAHPERLTIGGVPVEIPHTLRDFLAAQDNQAEVVLAKGHALVLSLNGNVIASPDEAQQTA